MPFEIVTLRERPEFVSVVRDRLWHAWWQDEGETLDALDAAISECLDADAIPTTFVAVAGNAFLGTVSLIFNDMAERPQYSPWVAALWVDESHRKLGLGARLSDHALEKGFEAGASAVYLYATHDNAPFYRKHGWQTVEPDVNGHEVFARYR
ncbi:GNAT family N-acetyltransferase [Mesorhizobium sp. RP14(2022)]|uniref:GNAT family N-acetyltransferase n=1 Tax=Mesorhizobium liriopis TaxID=2953882 RepID=A0ABT1C454_9HYPH|nr:GNAT family N-acetyltransferase [Mesorhizobium liriopis]MCO6049567.1 GNAT family N-acetyltransferase [Mesorhizobium liriopis]